MAIVFSYPPIGKNDVQPSDRLLLSQMTVNGNPTRSVTVNTFRQYLGAIIPTNIVTGSGTTNRLTKWKAPVGSGVIEDSSIEDTGSEINVPYKFNVNNATSNANGIVFPHPAGGASGIVNMYYNGAAAGSRFVISRAATGGAEIELQSNGDVNINRLGNGNFLVGGEVTLDDYGAGTITGTPTFYLAVDANGKIIEETSAGGIGGGGTINAIPKFTAANTIGDSSMLENALLIELNKDARANNSFDFNDELRANNSPGISGNVLVSQGPGQTPAWADRGYKAVQIFQWTAGNPVPYTNFPIGTTSGLPFDATPLVERGNPPPPGSLVTHAWSCANAAGGTAGQIATFTLGADGGGIWQIDTCQHWFDQNQFLEVNVDFIINGTRTAVINQRVNDGAGDRLFNGGLARLLLGGTTLVVEVTFANGTGTNPFPAATNNRPIEIQFTRLWQ